MPDTLDPPPLSDTLRSSSLVADEFGITLQDRGSPVGLTISELIELGLRRNPRRAQLLVSTVLGKHLAADPRVITGTGRLLGALVARALAGQYGEVPDSWLPAARGTVSGADPWALIDLLDALPPPANHAVLTFGFAETATSLGHLVADQLGSAYLHSTRRRDGLVPVSVEFAEPHSHATGHLLRPDPADLLAGDGPVVLVDDELSTGRTALNVIEALHAVAPRGRYVLAGLVDVRSAADDLNRAAVADRLGCRIDVVSLAQGGVVLPEGIVDRVAAALEGARGFAPAAVRSTAVRSTAVRSVPVQSLAVPSTAVQSTPEAFIVNLPWPVDLPTGGRHGFLATHRPTFDEAVQVAASALATAVGPAQRVLVLGTEELMYLPLRLALDLAGDSLRRVMFQSTTRSPVHAIDRPGYPIRRRIDFQSAVLDEPGSASRHVYNVCWPDAADPRVLREADLVVVVDDGHALSGAGGVAQSISVATGVPVLLAVLTPRPSR